MQGIFLPSASFQGQPVRGPATEMVDIYHGAKAAPENLPQTLDTEPGGLPFSAGIHGLTREF